MNKKDLKLSASVFGRTIFAVIICFFIYLSMTFLFSAMSTHLIGYRTHEKTDDGATVFISEHLFEAGEEQTVPPSADDKHINEPVYSQMSNGLVLAQNIITQIFMAMSFAALIYSTIGTAGEKDINEVQFNGAKEDKMRGLKIGLVAAIPSFILYLGIIACKIIGKDLWMVYKIMNISFRPLIDWITGGAMSISDVSMASMLCMIFIVAILPLICFACYRIGYSEAAFLRKLIYKKKK